MVSNFMMSNQKTVIRSNPPGTKSQDFYQWSEQNLEEMDSTLAVQQYIQQMIRRDYTDTEAILTMPIGQDEGVWKYEQLRQFCLELNGLAVRLQEECKPAQCWQMTATDQWIFLCAAHKTPQECAAIDYTRHTLDGAACLLNSNKYFPSRVNIKESSVNKLGSVCRRVYRIFSHAYYHHRQVFDEAENETYLCRRFTRFVIKYELMSRENLIVPIFPSDDDDDDDDDILGSNNITIIQQKHDNKILPQFGGGCGGQLANILNLPPGVGPDDDDEDEDDDVEGMNFLNHQELDDGFSFTAGFGTMKPMKKKSAVRQQLPQVVDDPCEEQPVEGGGELAADMSGDNNSFVDMLKNNNSTTASTYLTLSAVDNDDDEEEEDDSAAAGDDDEDSKVDESDC